MAPVSTDSSAWKKYVEQQQGGTGKFNEGGWFQIEYNGRILKYRVAVFGTQPSTGYPLYIGLHGGGATDMSKNDKSWKDLFVARHVAAVIIVIAGAHLQEVAGIVVLLAVGAFDLERPSRFGR
jgi:hypothetical protein